MARVTAIGCPHHVTQRGNARQFILTTDADRLVYLELLHHYCDLHGVTLTGYCLMSSHVHLVATPRAADSLSLALKYTHERFATYFNARYVSSGHVWQGRFFSCPLDRNCVWSVLRYVENNPVRARLVTSAAGFPWSSAAVHCCGGEPALLDLAAWSQAWTPGAWADYLRIPADPEEVAGIRRNTHTGRPLGSPGFVKSLERALNRTLAPSPGGRPADREGDSRQLRLF